MQRPDGKPDGNPRFWGDEDHVELMAYLPDSERRKFWGPNAIPMAIQFVAGIAMVYFLVWIGFADFVYDASGVIICPFITCQ